MSRKQFFVLTILLIVGLVIGHNGMSAYGKSNAPKAAEKTSIDQIKLSAPQSSDLQNYLGVQNDSEFNLTQIRAKLILNRDSQCILPGLPEKRAADEPDIQHY